MDLILTRLQKLYLVKAQKFNKFKFKSMRQIIYVTHQLNYITI